MQQCFCNASSAPLGDAMIVVMQEKPDRSNMLVEIGTTDKVNSPGLAGVLRWAASLRPAARLPQGAGIYRPALSSVFRRGHVLILCVGCKLTDGWGNAWF